jgi:hypothetical protein
MLLNITDPSSFYHWDMVASYYILKRCTKLASSAIHVDLYS